MSTPIVPLSGRMRSIRIAVFMLSGLILAAQGFGARPARPASSTAVAPGDDVTPGIVIVKLSAEGARQYAAGNKADVLRTSGATLTIKQIEEAFAGHSIARYSPSNEGTMAVRGPQIDDDLSRIILVHYADGLAPRQAASSLASSPFVEYAEPLPVRHACWTPNDPMLSQQWHIPIIHAPEAWDIEKGDSNVVIGIVDNGVEYTHPDLAPNIWTNPGEMGLDSKGRDKRTNGIDDDGDGYVDDWHGWDFAGASAGSPQDNDPSGGDHGVHVSGIAAARADNGIGVAGVAPFCKLMVVKVAYDQTPGSLNFGFEGITWAADHGARIINCSWGGGNYSTTEQAVIDYATKKGSLVVCAAGNNGSDVQFFPASYKHVLSVTGSTSADGPDPFYANWGPRVDVIAPGSNITSTYNGASYTQESGTSMASPCASGVAALVASHFPNLGPDQIAARVRVTSDPIDKNLYYTYQRKFGFGRVNAYKAVHDADVKAVWIDTVYVTNDDNGNGQLEPGETGSIRVRFKNMLAPTVNLTATLIDTVYGVTPYIQILTPTTTVGAVASLDTATTLSSAFRVKLAPNTPQDVSLWFRVDFQDGAYSDYRYFQYVINPTYITMAANDVGCSFGSRGNDAYNDFPTNLQGVGFTYKGSESLLYEGAFVLGTDATHVVDVARGAAQGGQDSAFVMKTRITTSTQGTAAAALEATGAFTDANANAASKLGVQVAMHHYQFNTAGNNNYVLLSYQITNTSSSTLKNLYGGVYLDWDIGQSGDSNLVQYDNANQFGWTQRVNSAMPVCGAGLVSEQSPTFFALDNNATGSNAPFWVNDDFTPSEKYTALSSGIGRATSMIGDVGCMVGGGPMTLAPNEQRTLAFVLSGGRTLSDLQQATNAARAKWKVISGTSFHQSIVFGDVYPQMTHDTTLVGAARNTSSSNVTAAMSLSGTNASEFSIVTPAQVSLSANAAADVTLRFSPVTQGSKTAQLVINYGASADTFYVFGNGKSFGLSVDPLLEFDTLRLNGFEVKYLTINNTGNDTVMFPYTITGADTNAFLIPAGSPITVGPGGLSFPIKFTARHSGTSTVTVNFTPSVGPSMSSTLIGYATPPLGVDDGVAPSASVLVANYPDPFATRTNITVTGASVKAMGVYDVLGRLVEDLTPRLTATGATFDASHLPAGSYYARVTLETGVVSRLLNVVK